MCSYLSSKFDWLAKNGISGIHEAGRRPLKSGCSRSILPLLMSDEGGISAEQVQQPKHFHGRNALAKQYSVDQGLACVDDGSVERVFDRIRITVLGFGQIARIFLSSLNDSARDWRIAKSLSGIEL